MNMEIKAGDVPVEVHVSATIPVRNNPEPDGPDPEIDTCMV